MTAIHPQFVAAALREVLQSSGCRVAEDRDRDNAPVLRANAGGLGFEARFVNSGAAWLAGAAERRFARLSLSRDRLLLEIDADALGGATAADLLAHAKVWDHLVQELIAYLEDAPSATREPRHAVTPAALV